MKRFYKDVSVAETDLGWTVHLDGRPIKTQAGQPQVLPSEAMAEMLAAEWRAQGEKIDPASFRFRDMADYALDVVARDAEAVIEKLVGYAETDTLCYRADPEEPLYRRQQEVWEPILAAMEAREGVTLHRVSGIVHKAQPASSLDTLRQRLAALGPFHLAALEQLTSLAASLCVGLEALEEAADGDGLWAAASLEEEWQADLWGREEEAEERRARRKGDFLAAMQFARAAS
ncbi:molecular chaperone [Qipengyuania sp. GH38]|uniref:ATP12 family chaperone protein n=1 Tax=Qipengyuania intermedia TaxID=2867244 RepID=UPI001C86B301|nr:ATP12 family protein [Qipengyuania intermedia]MBX7514576.1 molecular chaperone [Qipengyuania intermedia]